MATNERRKLPRAAAAAGVGGALLGLLLTSCAAPSAAPQSNELTVVTNAEPATLDYAQSGIAQTHTFVARSITEPLVAYDESTRSTVGVLATDWNWDGDLTWTFTLREDVMFHSGDAFDADDVVYSIQRYLADDSTVASSLSMVASVEAVGSHEVEFTTNTVDPIFDSNLVRTLISSKEFAEEHGVDYLSTHIDGTGPYALSEWARGQEISLDANPDYWGTAPQIESIQILFRDDPSVRNSMVRAGEAQLAWQVAAEDAESAPQSIQQNTTSIVFMRPNTKTHPALSDERVRQAMLYAIDQNTLSDTIFKGVTVPVTGNQPVNPGAVGFVEDMDVWPYDLDKANQLVSEAAADGVDVTASITISPLGEGRFPRANEFVEYAAQAWKEIGLTGVKIEVLEPEQWTEAFVNVDTEAGPVADLLYVDTDNPNMDYTRAGRFIWSKGSASLFSDPEIDAMYEQAVTLSGDERNAAFQELSRTLEPLAATLNFGILQSYHSASANLVWTATSATDPDFVNMRLE